MLPNASLAIMAAGEVAIHGRNGQIRDKHTIAPGNDPRNIRG